MDTLLEIYRSNFYLIDFMIGGLTPAVVYFLYRTGRVPKFVWPLFWVGFAIGLSWEVPMQVLNEVVEGGDVHRYIRPLPVHFSVVIVMHSLWDGGIFLAGILSARLVCKGPVLQEFRWCELLTFILWGQASALAVEMTSISGQAWVYITRPWNPPLFHFMGEPVTVMIQAIWLLAPIVFYFAALKIRPFVEGPSG